MITTIFLLSVFSPSPAPTEELERLGYVAEPVQLGPRTSVSPIRSHIQEFKGEDGSKLRVRSTWTMNLDQERPLNFEIGSKEHFEYMAIDSAVNPKSRELPSGLPPKFSRTYSHRSVVRIVVDTTWASVDCTWVGRIGTTSKGFAAEDAFDYNTKVTFVERVLRKTLANAAGLRLDQNGSSAIAGRTIASAKCRRTGRVFGGLTQWAQAENWTLSEDSTYGFFTMKKGNDWAVLPLGADQLKVNGVWKEMGDSAAYFKGKLYLPAAGLEHLRGA